MRNEVVAQGVTLTVGELRSALTGLDDSARVMVEGWCIDAVESSDLEVVFVSEDAREVPGDY